MLKTDKREEETKGQFKKKTLKNNFLKKKKKTIFKELNLRAALCEIKL